MDLIQLGITASRANRGKSVNRSIAQRMVRQGYERNWGVASWIPEDFFGVYPEKDGCTHPTHFGTLEIKELIGKEADYPKN